MLENIRKFSFLSKILNIQGSEWPRVLFAWMIRFLYRFGFVVGWTVIVSMFVSRYGIASLPYLFVVNALFTIIGSFLYSVFLEKFDRAVIMIATVFIVGMILFAALYFATKNELLFFALLVTAEAVFLMQFKILLDGFTEEMFTPLESERTFPVIEASETIGGILAGVVVVSLVNSIDISSFVYIWIALLFAIVPFLAFYGNIMNEVTLLKREDVKKEKHGILTKIKKQFSKIEHISFVKGLFLVVFLQWFLFNLLDFQYTKAVYQNVSHVVLEGGSGFEHAFVHNLGVLAVIFSTSALIFQVFLGGRIIRSLGIVGSMILHPVVTLLSLLGLTGSFNFYTAVFAKNNFTVTNGIYTNAYHSSYYAVSEKLREYTREVLEGIVRPVGAFMGTLALIGLQLLVKDKVLILSVNILMIIATLTMLVVTYRQQRKYTKVAIEELNRLNDKKARFNAVDILAQKGHKSSLPVLIKILKDENENVFLRRKILQAFAELKEQEALPSIINTLDSSESLIRDEALNTLSAYEIGGDKPAACLIIKYDLMTVLKRLYKTEQQETVRAKIITLLSKLSNVASVEFLLEILKTSSLTLKVNIIKVLGNYGDIDVSKFIKTYLNSSNPQLKISAAIGLGRFEEYRNQAEYIVYSFLYSKNKTKIICALDAIGELKLKNKKSFCLKYLDSKDLTAKLHSAVALGKMRDGRAIDEFVNLILSKDRSISESASLAVKDIDVHIFRKIDRIVRTVVSQEVNKIMNKNKSRLLNDLDLKDLWELRSLYALIHEYDEVEFIDSLKPQLNFNN